MVEHMYGIGEAVGNTIVYEFDNEYDSQVVIEQKALREPKIKKHFQTKKIRPVINFRVELKRQRFEKFSKAMDDFENYKYDIELIARDVLKNELAVGTLTSDQYFLLWRDGKLLSALQDEQLRKDVYLIHQKVFHSSEVISVRSLNRAMNRLISVYHLEVAV